MKYHLVMWLDYYNKPWNSRIPSLKTRCGWSMEFLSLRPFFFLTWGPWEGRCDPFLPSKSRPSCAIAQGACGRRSEWNRPTTTTTAWVTVGVTAQCWTWKRFFWVSLKKNPHILPEWISPSRCLCLRKWKFIFWTVSILCVQNPQSFFQRFHLQQLFKMHDVFPNVSTFMNPLYKKAVQACWWLILLDLGEITPAKCMSGHS